ncbi:hypothetical protein D4764_13G0012550 [Takifugu flavidus]|uniref:Uncharacterized protein n=1 Tax=Takifugu flavidus TaxID=433684 RepID=A0A5C6PAQ1_9TELE|nr:hypothetical protein D4764_13G0012550 [Takifugu flavidus]
MAVCESCLPTFSKLRESISGLQSELKERDTFILESSAVASTQEKHIARLRSEGQGLRVDLLDLSTVAMSQAKQIALLKASGAGDRSTTTTNDTTLSWTRSINAEIPATAPAESRRHRQEAMPKGGSFHLLPPLHEIAGFHRQGRSRSPSELNTAQTKGTLVGGGQGRWGSSISPSSAPLASWSCPSSWLSPDEEPGSARLTWPSATILVRSSHDPAPPSPGSSPPPPHLQTIRGGHSGAADPRGAGGRDLNGQACGGARWPDLLSPRCPCCAEVTSSALQLSAQHPSASTLVLEAGINDLKFQQSEVLKQDFISLVDCLLDTGKRLIISGPLPPPRYGDIITSRLLPPAAPVAEGVLLGQQYPLR